MNPSGSSELDTLDFPEEWNLDKKHETSTDYLRGLDNPQREQLVRVPTDGTAVIWNAPFKPLSVDIINSTGQSLNITDEVGDIIQVAGGSLVSMPVNGSAHYTFQLASADSTKRACFCIFYRYRRSVAGASAAGGAASSVTIAGPLDGSGNVKTALEAAIPAGGNTIGNVGINAGTNTIGNVELIDGVGGINKATIDASNNLHTFVSSGQVTAFGSAAAALAQNAQNETVVDDRAAQNWATAQLNAGTIAAQLAVARPTRQRIVVRNLDPTNSMWIGPATVTTANGVVLKPGESRTFYTQTLLQFICSAGTPTAEIDDYWT